MSGGDESGGSGSENGLRARMNIGGRGWTGGRRGRGQPQPLPQRAVANPMDQRVLSLNERILNEVFNIYADKDTGLVRLGKLVDIDIPYPRRKVTVMILGNHSAGKSSFINWYIEETIMKTGVAIETQGFVFVTSGKKRESLKGLATLQLYPHLKPLEELPGVVEYLSTEVSTSRSRKFNLVTFIDTPGLVDGDMNYPFDVNDSLLWLGGMSDLVFVFFDPMGQALCKRTLNILEALWSTNSEKMRLYLAKADEAGTETDRQKVLMQIVQELCKRPGLNRTGFEMPTIYLPEIRGHPEGGRPNRSANQINEVCDEIEKAIEQTVQNSLNMLERDGNILAKKIDTTLIVDAEARKRNFSTTLQRTVFSLIGFFLPLILLGVVIVANSSLATLRKHIGIFGDFLSIVLSPLVSLWSSIPASFHLQIITVLICFSAICLILSRLFTNEKVLPNRDLSNLRHAQDIVKDSLIRKKAMYSDYLRQSLAENEFLHNQSS